jgi:AraC-like DNA-binding protein
MNTIYDERTVKPGDSFDRWHDVTCRNYSETEFRRESDEPFSAQIASREFGALALSDVSSSSPGSTRLIRRPLAIRKDPRDHFTLLLVKSGEVGVQQDDRALQAQAGDLFLYDQTQPFTLDFHQRYCAIMMNIPRPLLEARLPTAGQLTARRIAGDSKLGGLARAIVHQLAGFDEEMEEVVVNRLGAAALDILATVLDAHPSDGPISHSGHHRLLARAQGYILAHLQEPGLDIETIARALNMAPRTLNRVFAAEGTTPIRWLWRQRLARSYAALTEGRVSNVTDAALTFGFRDLSHFSRTFKLTFGKLPHDLTRR